MSPDPPRLVNPDDEPSADPLGPADGAEGNRLFRILVESIADTAVILLDASGTILTWNPGAAQLTGYQAGEIVGQSFELLYTEEAIAVSHPERELEAAAVSGHHSDEGWRVRKDGTRFWAEFTITAIYHDNGELDAFGKVVRDLTSRKQAEERHQAVLALLEATVRVDVLTGLPNRRGWDETFASELARAKRDGSPLCVGMLDIDGFKQINDEQGHKEGDRILRQAALRWRGALRPSDFVARYGGEEFAIVLPGCHGREALRIIERLRTATPEGTTCSVGVAEWDRAETDEELFSRADRALYRAKEQGRDRAELSTESPADRGKRTTGT